MRISKKWCGDYMACSTKMKVLNCTIIEQWGEDRNGNANGPHFFDILVGTKKLFVSESIPMKKQVRRDYPLVRESFQVGRPYGVIARFGNINDAVKVAHLF